MKHEGQKHTSPNLLACGLHIYKPQPYIGATPDNIFTCSCCEGTCVEYKCPYSIRKEEISVSWKKMVSPYKVGKKVVLIFPQNGTLQIIK